MKTHEKIILLSLVILCGNVAIGYRIYKSNEKINNSEKWVRHTEKVISESETIVLLAKDLQIAVLSAAANTIPTDITQKANIVFRHIERIRELTINNPIQQIRIDSLKSTMHHYVNGYLLSAGAYKTGLSGSTTINSHNTSTVYTHRISLILQNIKAEESVLLQQRRATNQHSLKVIKSFSIIMYVLMTFFIILLLIATGKYLVRIEIKQKRENELLIINRKFSILNTEKEKRAAELVIANQELANENYEKEKRAAELVIANTELAFQNSEKESRAAELVIANSELANENHEKEKRAAELVIANTELAFQNSEKENRAAELVIANTELANENCEKEKRAAELVIANTELAFQNSEKENRAAELVIANKELAFQNEEKEKRASELIIANNELAFQNSEKENRAAELIIANTELANENCEKEKRAVELTIANQNLKTAEEQQLQHINGLEEMMFMTSHRVRQPVSNILGLSALLRDSDSVSEQELLIDGLEKSASNLDTFTRELTELLDSLQQIGR